jgi:UDP-glucose 4-epimerase
MSSPQLILITGVNGFIGRYVARYFTQQNWTVIGIGKSSPENAPTENLTNYYRLQLPHSDLNEIVKKYQPNLCIHCAGRASVPLSLSSPDTDFHSNTVITFELLNCLRNFSPKCKFILLSSAAVYGNPASLPVDETQLAKPISPYGFHKLYCEQLCLEFAKVYQLSTASVRIFSAYGPGLRRQVVWDICNRVITQPVLKLKSTGKESRDFIHVKDIIQALAIISERASMEGEVYNLGSGTEISIAQLAQMIIDISGSNKVIEFDGIFQTGTPLNWQANISKLEKLGFSSSIPFEEGIRAFFNWCKAEVIGI